MDTIKLHRNLDMERIERYRAWLQGVKKLAAENGLDWQELIQLIAYPKVFSR